MKMAFWPRSCFLSSYSSTTNLALYANVQVQKINAHGDGVDFELATIGWLLHK